MDQPPVEDLGIELPIEAVRNLTECQRMLQEAVTAGTFTVSVSVEAERVEVETDVLPRFLRIVAEMVRT